MAKASAVGPVYMRGWLTLNEAREIAGLARIAAVEPEVSADRRWGRGGRKVWLGEGLITASVSNTRLRVFKSSVIGGS